MDMDDATEEMPKYALIHWVNGNCTSIVKTADVCDLTMIVDNQKIGKVKAVIAGKREPPQGWLKYDARVLATNDKWKVLEEFEKEWIASDTEADLNATASPRGRQRLQKTKATKNIVGLHK
ncbi:PREDICTED: uncharacterized protein LOC106811051 [Priapulus caudatus]|uniref:Uncharacterized protein LOC106811051 n=1 Tax=Priapulus caudatus TaxID=37621 RepID=A0ABM1ECY8_PRICU|nr:PREDICTED: uncharacterized protein LOC106811051 [Priapulus caudatus]